MPAIPVKHTSVDQEGAWDAGAALKNLGDQPTETALRNLHAWVDGAADPLTKSAYKLPHHEVSEAGTVGAANMKGVESAMGRLNGGGLDIPLADRKDVHAHLAAHYKDAGMDAPELKGRWGLAKHFLRLEIKQISAVGTFEGLLSPYGNVDRGNDVIDPGAFAKNLKDEGFTRPLLWQHQPDAPIGLLTLEDRPDGLWCTGALMMEDPEAVRAYRYVKAGIVKGLSIGFQCIKDAFEDGVRHIKELKLYEGSIVTFPMNELATITAVKGLGGTSDFNEELAKQQICDAGDQMMQALYCGLCEVRYSDLTKDDRITASQTICQQFTEAYMAYLPVYIDMMAAERGSMEMRARQALETKNQLDKLRTKLIADIKAGRMHSAATMDQYKAMAEHVATMGDCTKGLTDILSALMGEEAGVTTSSAGVAGSKATEPGDHSALILKLDELKGLSEWNLSNRN